MGKLEKMICFCAVMVCLFMIFKPTEKYDKSLAGQKRIVRTETESYNSGDEVVLSGNTMESINFESELLETQDGKWVFECDLF